MQSPDPDLPQRRPAKRSAQRSSARLRQQNTNDTVAFYPFPASLGPPAPIYAQNGPGQCRLPLDVLSVIISYLWESPADLAAISRVSRIMHYLATPLLYREVRLRGAGRREKCGGGTANSKGKKRKRECVDEFGFNTGADGNGNGANQASPESACTASSHGMSVFLVGLATLQRPAVSKVVRKLVLEGELEEGSLGNINDICSSSTGAEGAPRTLSWSESDGMFGLAVGGTVGSLTDLQELCWKLKNAYIHPMLWYSLARHPTLSALTYLCPSSTTLPPQIHIPTTFVPAFQNLTSLSILDIDGSHPPDDFSRVAFGSPGIEKLKTLRLAWVDGNEYEKQKGAEVGGGLAYVFGARIRSLAASRGSGGGGGGQPTIKKLTLRKLELMNLYIPPGDLSMEFLFDCSTIEFLTYLNCSIFDSWPTIFSPNPPPASTTTTASSPATSTSSPPATTTPSSASSSPAMRPRPLSSLTTLRTDSLHPPTLHLLSHTYSLQNIYLLPPPTPLRPIPTPLRNTVLTILLKNHLHSLHRLLLPPHLLLSKSHCSKLVLHSPPTLCELAFACDRTQWGYLAVLLSFLTNLTCFHLLHSPEIQPLRHPSGGLFWGTEPEVEKMERRLGDVWGGGIVRLLGVGECLWRVDRVVSMERKKRSWGGGGGVDGPSMLLPSQRVRRAAFVEEGCEGEGCEWERCEGEDSGDESAPEEEEAQECGHGVWVSGDGNGVGVRVRGAEGRGNGESNGESEEMRLRRLDEEFMRRETSGEIPKRKTQRVSKDEVLTWGVIREGIYGIRT